MKRSSWVLYLFEDENKKEIFKIMEFKTIKDLSYVIEKNSFVKIITHKDSDGLDAIRHDTTHIMAMAVQEIFPGTKLAIGPAIKDGFYYDFARDEPFTPKDLEKIEKKMKEIVENTELTRREVWERNKTQDHYKKLGEKYKVELVDSIQKEIGRAHV